jgi:hypothetical protein
MPQNFVYEYFSYIKLHVAVPFENIRKLDRFFTEWGKSFDEYLQRFRVIADRSYETVGEIGFQRGDHARIKNAAEKLHFGRIHLGRNQFSDFYVAASYEGISRSK